MKRNKVNIYMVLGLLIISIKHIIEIPNDFGCFSTGMGVIILGFGLYAMNHDITKLKTLKRNFIKKLMNTD